MNARWKLLSIALAPMMLFCGFASAADAHAILTVPQQRIETADFETAGRLVRVDADGTRTSYGISIKAHGFPGVVRVLVDVTSPASAREHILLAMHFNGTSSIEIARPGDQALAPLPFEKWSDGPLGPGFSFEDFLEQQYFWPVQAAEPATKYGARDCDLLKSIPGPSDRTHYAQEKIWLDQTIGFPVYVEKTVKGTGAVKEFTYMGLRHNGGVWSASQIEEKTRAQAGSTLLIIDRGSAKANLTLADFGSERVMHF